MTLRQLLRFAFAFFLLVLAMPAFYSIGYRLADADPAPSGSALVNDSMTASSGSGSGSGSGSATSSPATAAAPMTADKLPSALDNPVAAYDELKTLKKQGWALPLLAGLIMLAKALASATAQWPDSKVLAWLATKKTAVAVAGVLTCAVAAFNALELGGTWASVALTVAGVGFALWHPTTLRQASA